MYVLQYVDMNMYVYCIRISISIYIYICTKHLYTSTVQPVYWDWGGRKNIFHLRTATDLALYHSIKGSCQWSCPFNPWSSANVARDGSAHAPDLQAATAARRDDGSFCCAGESQLHHMAWIWRQMQWKRILCKSYSSYQLSSSVYPALRVSSFLGRIHGNSISRPWWLGKPVVAFLPLREAKDRVLPKHMMKSKPINSGPCAK